MGIQNNWKIYFWAPLRQGPCNSRESTHCCVTSQFSQRLSRITAKPKALLDRGRGTRSNRHPAWQLLGSRAHIKACQFPTAFLSGLGRVFPSSEHLQLVLRASIRSLFTIFLQRYRLCKYVSTLQEL